MRFLWEFMACCGSCSSTPMVKEEARLLAASAPPPNSETCGIRGRKRGRATGRSGHNSSSGVEWRPSLSSICEDNVLHERNKMEDHHRHHHQEVDVTVVRSSSSSSSPSSSERSPKRKITSAARSRSYCPREDVRRPAVHAVMPTFAPAPFTF